MKQMFKLVPLLAIACSTTSPQEATEDSIRDTLEANEKAIRQCYIKENAYNPELEGHVVLSWTIQRDGKVRESSLVRSSLKNHKIERCVVNKILYMTFEPPRTKKMVHIKEHTFEFEPDSFWDFF